MSTISMHPLSISITRQDDCVIDVKILPDSLYDKTMTSTTFVLITKTFSCAKYWLNINNPWYYHLGK
ncbi:MAG TPA: hypothetical protein VFM31_00080 [Nitrososphaeraceae archaeon]|nr:hypothetical protein [Nitrososphaeraceae archaeon]